MMNSNEIRLQLGAAWYPEQYPSQTWSPDLRSMRELGLTAVRIGEFAWTCLEPEEGRYDFAWLLEAMDLLAEHEIGCVLCTPTATPPHWLLKRHPEVGFVDATGYQHKHGARQHASYNSPIFREYSRRITRELAQAISGHTALIAWQTDNELGSHQQRCFSPGSVAKWRQWLEKRYGHIDALNEAWRTVVWSQRYASFDDVPPPYQLCYYTHNFALTLNYRRFMADAIAEFQAEQVAIIKEYSNVPVTHNSTTKTDDWRLTRALDFASSDIYTCRQPPTNIHFRFDFMRNILPGSPYWTMETSSEDFLEGILIERGWMGCFSFLNYAMGGTGLFYWPWKQQPGGAEIINNSIVYANGQPSTGWDNVAEAVEVRKLLEPVMSEFRPEPADVVFVRSEVNGRYLYEDSAGGLEPNYDYAERVRQHYQTLLDLGAWRDVIFDEAELPDCRVLLTPYLPCLSDSLIERALELVEQGATWVAGPYCGMRTRDHTAHTDYLLGRLEERIGFKTRYLFHAGALAVDIGGRAGHTSQFATMFEPQDEDEVLGVYTTKRFQGMAWGLRRVYGKGSIYLPGTELDQRSRRQFLRSIFEREGIRRYPMAERVTTIPLRSESGRQALALCNWGGHEQVLSVGEVSLLASSGEVSAHDKQVFLQPFSWAVAELMPSRQPAPVLAEV